MRICLMNRPENNKDNGVFLSEVMRRLCITIHKTQQEKECRAIRLSKSEIINLAETLTEFGEDIHCNIGLWVAYEQHNIQCFDAPLPLTSPATGDNEYQPGITEDRVLHYLWVIYPQLLRDLKISPSHQGLVMMARATTFELQKQFEGVPKESSVKRFLESPNGNGYEVKRKLVWIGTRSYFFRHFFKVYRDEKAEEFKKNPIGVTDDFVCQECTEWSGLSVNNLLASVLSITKKDREDLDDWSFRHLSAYLVLSAGPDVMEVRNIVSGGEYNIRINIDPNPFKKDMLVFGSLVPWRGEWYWSGEQQCFPNATSAAIEEIKSSFLSARPRLVYRYCPDRLEIAREHGKKQYENNVARFGGPLAIFPNGLTFVEAMNQSFRDTHNVLSPAERERVQKKHGIPPSGPSMQLPESMMKTQKQVGIHFNPEGGMDVWEAFEELVAGLRNATRPLPTDDACMIRCFMESRTMSPEFVRSMTALYGEQSIKATYSCSEKDGACAYFLEYLLRRFKGEFFKKRFPMITVI